MEPALLRTRSITWDDSMFSHLDFMEAVSFFESTSALLDSGIITSSSLTQWQHTAKYTFLQLLQSWIPHDWHNDRVQRFRNMLINAVPQLNTTTMCFDTREVWTTPFIGRRFDELNLPALINSPKILAAFPKSTLARSGYPIVCWKYERNAGSFIISDKAQVKAMKHHKISSQCTVAQSPLKWKTKAQVQASYTCSCASDPFWKGFTDTSGHVCTSDLSCIRNSTLRNLMKKGPTFRPDFLQYISPISYADDDKELFAQTISAYITESANNMKCSPMQYAEWKGLILEELYVKIDDLYAENTIVTINPISQQVLDVPKSRRN